VSTTGIDTFINIGCGTRGTGNCPAGASGGGAVAHLDNVEADGYGDYTNGAVFMSAPVGADLSLGTTNTALIVPHAGAGGLMGAGADGTTAAWTIAELVHVNANGTVVLNPGSLPTSCTGQSIGTFYVPSAHVLGVC
jgi:hypothetical protein